MTRMRVALLTAGDPGSVTGGYLFHRRMADAAERHDAQVTFVSVPDAPLAWALASGPAWLRAAELRRADVVVLDSIAAAAAAPWLAGVRAPIVGMLHQLPGGMDAHPVARRVRAPFDRWAYRRADVLMVASEWLATQLIDAGVPASRLRVVPPGKDVAGVPATLVPEAREGDRRMVHRRGRRAAALCAANWLPRKGILELLEAVSRMPEELVTLHLVGDTRAGGRYARSVRARLRAPDLRRRVVVHGIVPSGAVHEMYRSVDLFVLPSYEEPYGTVWGEAMAAGLPVIGWRAGNLPFLADHGREALLAPPGDVNALAASLESLAADAGLRTRMGRAAARRAEGRPTWDETAATFFSIISEAAARHRGSRRGPR